MTEQEKKQALAEARDIAVNGDDDLKAAYVRYLCGGISWNSANKQNAESRENLAIFEALYREYLTALNEATK